MADYTVNLGIQKPVSGAQAGQWGGTVNVNMDQIDQAISGSVSVQLTSLSTTITITDTGDRSALSDGRNAHITFTDSGISGAATVTFDPNTCERLIWITNAMSGNQENLIVSQGSGANVTIRYGYSALCKFDGAGGSAAVANVLTSPQFANGFAFINNAGNDEISFVVDSSDDITITVNSVEAAKYDSSATSWNFNGLTVGGVKVESVYEKDITIESPTATEEISWFYTNRAITVQELVGVYEGTGTSVELNMYHALDRDTAGTLVDLITVDSKTTGTIETTISSAAIPANSFVWIKVGTVTGTIDSVGLHMEATID